VRNGRHTDKDNDFIASLLYHHIRSNAKAPAPKDHQTSSDSWCQMHPWSSVWTGLLVHHVVDLAQEDHIFQDHKHYLVVPYCYWGTASCCDWKGEEPRKWREEWSAAVDSRPVVAIEVSVMSLWANPLLVAHRSCWSIGHCLLASFRGETIAGVEILLLFR